MMAILTIMMMVVKTARLAMMTLIAVIYLAKVHTTVH